MWTRCYVSVLSRQGAAGRHSPHRVTEQSVMGSGSRNRYVRSSCKLMKQAKNLTPTYSTHLLLSEQDRGGDTAIRNTVCQSIDFFFLGLLFFFGQSDNNRE